MAGRTSASPTNALVDARHPGRSLGANSERQLRGPSQMTIDHRTLERRLRPPATDAASRRWIASSAYASDIRLSEDEVSEIRACNGPQSSSGWFSCRTRWRRPQPGGGGGVAGVVLAVGDLVGDGAVEAWVCGLEGESTAAMPATPPPPVPPRRRAKTPTLAIGSRGTFPVPRPPRRGR
jgi:hypothetical protein